MGNQFNLPAHNHKNLQFPLTVFLVISFISLLVIAVVVYSFSLGHKMSMEIAPLVGATKEIKLETTTAHLWLEEIISGDRHETINQVTEHIDTAMWYANAMLKGGENPQGKIVPLTNPMLRKDIREVIEKIIRFKEILAERSAAVQTSGPGTPIDQRFDALFEDFIQQADLVETRLQASIAADLQQYQYLQLLLLFSIVLLTLFLLLVFYKFEKRRVQSSQLIHQAQEQVKVLSGFLPVCGTCKKIRDDDGYWHRVEDYIKDNSEAVVNDSICPVCAKKLVQKFCPAGH